MSSLCCRSGRSESPGLPNNRVLEPVREKDSIGQRKDAQAIKAIFRQSSSAGEGQGSDVDLSTPDEIHRRPSTLRLHEVTTKIRKRLSRDSGVSKKSYRKVRSATSEEEIERRREMKRASHRRMQEELLTDRIAEQGSYDSDAESLVTPTFDDIDAHGEKYFKPAGVDKHQKQGGLSESSCTSDELLLPREGSPVKAGAILGITIQGCSPQWAPKASSSPQVAKHLTSLSTSPPKISTRRSSKHSGPDFALVSRSNTVKRTHPVGSPNKRYSSLPRQRTRGLTPGGIPSTRRVQSAQLLDDGKQSGGLNDRPSCGVDYPYTNDTLGVSSFQDAACTHADTEAGVSDDQPRATKPRPENSPPTPHDTTGSGVAEVPVEQPNHHVRSEPSVHLYDMRISQRLASRSLIPSHSLPHLSNDGHNNRHKRGKSSVSSFSVYSTKAERRRQTSSTGFASAKVPGSWGNVVKDGASSIYPSQDNSLPSTSSSSLNHLGYILSRNQAKGYESIASELARDYLRFDDSHAATESAALRRRTIGSSDDIRQPFRPETLSVPQASTLHEEAGISAGRPFSLGIQSLHQLEGDHFLGPQSNALNGVGYDGSAEKRLSSWKLDPGDLKVFRTPISRQGSTLSITPNANDEDAAAVWERALRNHASHDAIRPGTKTSIYSNDDNGTDRSSKERTVSQERVLTGRAEDPACMNDVLTHFKKIDYGSSSLKPRSSPRAVSWSRFPSHTKHERTSSAGESDKVIPRDFAVDTGSHSDAANARIERGHLIERKKKKSRSMTFGKNMFKSWGRLHKSQSADFRRYGAGHRSSITVGGILEYPELEILPPVLASLTPSNKHVASLSDPSQHEKMVKTDLVYLERANPEPRIEMPSGARVWSQLYASCVDLPNDTEPNNSAEIENSEQQATLLSSGWKPSHLRHLSANSATDLRRPTRDFEELLRAGEKIERDKVLKAAEEAWGK